MKIKYAITACDNNPLYYEFWPIVSKLWKKLIDIEPILIYVGDKLPLELQSNEYGQIIMFKPLSGISTSTQSQFIRLWYPQNFPEDVCVTTDIDMLPLSKGFFTTQIKNIYDDEFVSFNLKGWDLSICYNIAKGKTFKKILKLDDDFDKTLRPFYTDLINKDKNREWFTDETYLQTIVNRENILIFIRENIENNRIDRIRWKYNPSLLKLGMYYDCHSLRPYSKYKHEIDKLINYLL